MTTTTERVPLAEAERLAWELIAQLEPACERILTVGSVRRKKPEVHDLQLLCQPRLTAQHDLFGEEIDHTNHLDDAVAGLMTAGLLAHRLDTHGRHAYGTRYKRLTYKGVGLDLFSCLAPAQWGIQSLIRTGPDTFSRRLVTQRKFGGFLPDGWHVKDGSIWDEAGWQVLTPEEIDVFRELGIAYVEPEARA